MKIFCALLLVVLAVPSASAQSIGFDAGFPKSPVGSSGIQGQGPYMLPAGAHGIQITMALSQPGVNDIVVNCNDNGGTWSGAKGGLVVGNVYGVSVTIQWLDVCNFAHTLSQNGGNVRVR